VALIETATIKLAPGDYIDVYVAVNGHMVPVRIEMEAGPAPSGGSGSQPQQPTSEQPEFEDYSELLEPRVDVARIPFQGSGGNIGLYEEVPLFLHSGGITDDVRDLLARVTEENHERLADIRIERTYNARSGRLLDHSRKSTIILDLEDLGGLGDG
jgi:hypothetical protein